MASVRRRYLVDLVRQVAPFLFLFAGVYIVVAVLFFFLEGGVDLFRSFYWAITTLSTVGYGDIVPQNDPARVVAMGAMFIQIFLLGYLISVISTAVTTEALKRATGVLGTDL